MSSKQRFVGIVLLAAAFSSVLGWMAFHAKRFTVVWSNPIIILMIVILGVAPIYPLCRTLSKRTRLSALAILLLIAGVLSGLVYLVGSLVLHIDTAWVLAASELSEGLIIASCVLVIWNGLVRKDR